MGRPLARAELSVLALCAVVALATAVVVGLDLDVPGRGWLVVAFALSAPGAALVCWLRLDNPALSIGSACAVSVVVLIVLAQTMVSVGVWSPQPALAALALASAVSLGTRVVVRRPASARPHVHAGTE